MHSGIKCTSMNVHLLKHVPDCVKLWGPTWAYSCFHFENANGYLKYLFHGTKDMTKQVIKDAFIWNAYISGLMTSNPAHQTMSSYEKASFCLVVVLFSVLAC